MHTDPLTSLTKEHTAAKGAGMARSALGWIQQIISDSVQEISDFSALLSAQANPEQPAASAVTPSSFGLAVAENAHSLKGETSPEPKLQSEFVQQARDQIKQQPREIHVNQGKNEAAPAPQESSDDQVPVLVTDSESDLAEEAPVSELKEQVELINTEVVTQVVSEVASEVVVAQAALAVVPLAIPLEKSETVAVETDATPQSQQQLQAHAAVALDQGGAEAQSLEPAVEQEIVNLVKSSFKSESVVDEKALAGNKKETLQASAPQTAPLTQEKPLASEMVATEVTKEASSDNAVSTLANIVTTSSKQATATLLSPSLSPAQGFMQGFLNASAQGRDLRSEGLNNHIESLGGLKHAAALSKTGLGDGNSNPQNQANKSIDAMQRADRSSVFSMGNGESSQKSESTKSSRPLTRGQSLATLEKVEAAMQKAAESRDGTVISMRLDPPTLGSVKVDVSLKEGLLHARISADSAQVLQLLRERAPDLQVTLRKLGLEVDRVSVSVNSEDQGTLRDNSEHQQGRKEQRSGNNFPELADSAVLNESLNLDHWIA